MVKINIKESIINYSKNKYYFHINDLKRYLIENQIKFEEDTLKKYLYLLKKNEIIYSAGRGWYSNIQKEFNLNTQPINKIMKLLLEKFPLLKFSCWSTEQLKGFFHHLPNQFVTFIYVDKDFLSTLKDFLTKNNYNTYLNPNKVDAEKFVELKTKTIILRPSVSFRISNEKNLTKIEKILVDLFMEMKKISLIDKEEYIKIISNIILDYRINMAEMLDYADRREAKERIWYIIKKCIESTNAKI
jgi:cellobiose-specific phosphotransferase system component IIB